MAVARVADPQDAPASGGDVPRQAAVGAHPPGEVADGIGGHDELRGQRAAAVGTLERAVVPRLGAVAATAQQPGLGLGEVRLGGTAEFEFADPDGQRIPERDTKHAAGRVGKCGRGPGVAMEVPADREVADCAEGLAVVRNLQPQREVLLPAVRGAVAERQRPDHPRLRKREVDR